VGDVSGVARPGLSGGEPGRQRQATSRDVASHAGVSQKTVSRVFNGEPYVAAEVRERVLAAARELGYRRNRHATALNTGRSHRIGVVSLGTALYGPATLLFAIERVIRRTDYSVTVVSTEEGQAGGVKGAIDALLDEGVDGIVLSEPIDEGAGFTLDSDVPVLSVGRFPGLTAPHTVISGIDGVAGGRMATEHLLSLGHRTVWHVAGPQRWWSAQDRLAGWRQALAEAGAAEPAFVEGDWSPASGYAAGCQLAATPGVTAVFAANDEMAAGVIRALADHGTEVPGQVSVVGYDDIPAAAFLFPRLTTIRQDFEAAAIRGIELLLRRIEHPDDPGVVPDDGPAIALVPRDSTASPRR
jgi:DNA-binding LacI/PurR family transcriptional regulator